MIKVFSFIALLTAGISGFDPEKHKNWKLLPHSTCGLTSRNRIIGGVEAPMNGYPWLALIGYKSPRSKNITFDCGGVVASSKTILTAAHCVTDLEGDKIAIIRLGEHNLKTNPDCKRRVCAAPVLDIPPSEIIMHKNFDNPALRHDIALIRLEREIKFSAYVKPICLGGRDFKKKNFTGTMAEVAGWGIYDIDTNKPSSILRFVKLKVVRNEVCEEYLPQDIKIGATQLCVGGSIGTDSCNGDSGGPLMKVYAGTKGPRYYLLGIVSFGAKKCGKTKMPGIYTKMSEYMNWFLNNFKETTSDAIKVQ